MMFDKHPLSGLVKTYSIHSDPYKNAERMAQELESKFEILAAMQPGNSVALDTLKGTSALMISIDQAFGTVHGWTRSQYARIFSEAVRLLGTEQMVVTAPNWREP